MVQAICIFIEFSILLDVMFLTLHHCKHLTMHLHGFMSTEQFSRSVECVQMDLAFPTNMSWSIIIN